MNDQNLIYHLEFLTFSLSERINNLGKLHRETTQLLSDIFLDLDNIKKMIGRKEAG
jgi:hypothetical protein